jgi:alpha-mannosidase
VRVTFSEPVRQASAETVANYKFDPPLTVAAAQLSPDQMTVELTVADLPADPNSPVRYQMTIRGVQDQSPAGNAVAAAPVPLDLVKPVFSVDELQAGSPPPEQPVAGLPVKAGDPWTINCFVKPTARPDGLIVIAGFGQCIDKDDGIGRYLSWWPNGLHFWSRNQDLTTRESIDLNKWQMLSATFDGKVLTLYKNAKPVATGQPSLADDQSVIRLAPLDPWSHTRRFHGDIRAFTVWPTALPAASLAVIHDSFGEK